MPFTKEILSDKLWVEINFDTRLIPYWKTGERPHDWIVATNRPRDWVVDRAVGVALIPATSHYDGRDGEERFLLIDNGKNRAIWLRLPRHPHPRHHNAHPFRFKMCKVPCGKREQGLRLGD